MNLYQEVFVSSLQQLSNYVDNVTSLNFIVKMAAFLNKLEIINSFTLYSTVPIQTLANIAAARNNKEVVLSLIDVSETSTFYNLDFTEICKYLVKYAHVGLLDIIMSFDENIDIYQLSVWAAVYGRKHILKYLLENYEQAEHYMDIIANILDRRGYGKFIRCFGIECEFDSNNEWYDRTIYSIINTPDDFERLLFTFPIQHISLPQSIIAEMIFAKYGYIENMTYSTQDLIADIEAANERLIQINDSVNLTDVLKYSIKYGYDSTTIFYINNYTSRLNLNMLCLYAVVFNRRRVLEHIVKDYQINYAFISDVIVYTHSDLYTVLSSDYQPSNNISDDIITEVRKAIDGVDYNVYLIQQMFSSR